MWRTRLMQAKNFATSLKERLDEREIRALKKQSNLEVQYTQFLQNTIAEEVKSYMEKQDIGFNNMVKKLDISTAKLAKILKGESNLTLTSIAHICALLEKKPKFKFE